MKKNILLFTLLFSLVLFGITGCKHDVEEIAPDCKVSGVTYENYIKYTISSKCLGCHTAGSIQPYMNTYAQVMVIVNDGRLKEVLTGAPGVMQMPYNSEPLPDCQVQNIVTWVDNGAPEM